MDGLVHRSQMLKFSQHRQTEDNDITHFLNTERALLDSHFPSELPAMTRQNKGSVLDASINDVDKQT